MTEPTKPSRTPYPNPGQVPASPRRRPSDERAAVAASSRTATRLAIVAIVVSAVALGLGVWRTVTTSTSGSPCQNTAWSAQPAANELPDQWSVAGTTFDVNRRTTQFAGQDTGSGTGAPNVLATVTCFPDGAADAVSRAAAAAREIGQTVTDRGDLSDGGYLATDASGASFLEFRRGDILVDLAASGGATTADIETVASAYDKALGGDGGSVSSQAPGASGDLGLASPGASNDAGASASAPAAPELEKLLPTKVGTVDLTVDSQLGTDVLQDDQGSRAITAALRAAGKTPADLRLAQAYDANQTSPLNLLAVQVDGMDITKVRQMVIDSWLAGSGAGVTQTPTTLSGKDWTKIDLGDGGNVDYVRTKDGVVFVITAPDAAQAAEAAAKLP